jgi:hypothetical protein
MIVLPSFRSGSAFCTVNSVPLTLMLNSLSECSAVTTPKGTNSKTPALAKIISIDLPLHFRDGLIETIEMVQFGNISLNASHVGADCLHGLVEFLLASARDEDVGASPSRHRTRNKK